MEFDDPIKYEEAVTHFSADCTCIFETHDCWADCEVVTDLAHESEALQLKVEEDKRQHKVEEARVQVEEAKAKVACDTGGHPKKQVCANTMGSSFVEASTLGAQKVLKVCLYCAKQGKFCL